MSLVVSLLFFLPMIALVGVSEFGEMALGKEGTASYAANATLWNTVASIGSPAIIGIFIILAVGLLICMVYSVRESGV